ncbi:MAG: hydrogenase maturation nickel metallochaperone HypA [Dehalococcoidales bacterium]|nr:hydrogenase maturation nickel metallochaperone HypA [Dehalococcoidales bacterium]
MHELSITQSILDIALNKAKEANAGKISAVSVTLGELSGIAADCVQFYFNFLTRDTIAAGASLTFEKVPTKLRCRKCDKDFAPEAIAWICPRCHEQSIEIVAGRECYINSIEVE